MVDVHPNQIAGSALNAKVAYQVDLDSTMASRDLQIEGAAKLSTLFKAGEDIDVLNSIKFPPAQTTTQYMLDGVVSVVPEIGNFKFSDSSNQMGYGAMELNKSKSSFLSSATTTKLGSTNIKTLTGSQINPAGKNMPSSSMTPQKQWIPSIFPAFSSVGISNFIMMKVALDLIGDIAEEPKDSTTVSSSRKSLGDIIVDNSDFELAILEGTI